MRTYASFFVGSYRPLEEKLRSLRRGKLPRALVYKMFTELPNPYVLHQWPHSYEDSIGHRNLASQKPWYKIKVEF